MQTSNSHSGIPKAHHHNPLLITNQSWILTINTGRIFSEKLLEKNVFDLQKVGLKYTHPVARGTPLHFVAYHGLSDVFDFMIEESQSVEECLTKNKRGRTPLHNMSKKGHADFIRSLRRKMDFESINPSLFKNILKKAIRYGQKDCIKALIENSTYQKSFGHLLN